MDERRKLIEKLKTVKDPKERDRIIWILDAKEKTDIEDESFHAASDKTTSPEESIEKEEKLPQMPAGIRKVFAYLVPVFFIFFGLMNIIGALSHFLTDDKESAIPQFIMGIMFLFFGLISFIKIKRQMKGLQASYKGAK